MVSAAPLVFISHDSRDARLAEHFSKLVKEATLSAIATFRSTESGRGGIPYGDQWFPTIIKRINAASDVVCLLTKRSLGRPWILFEAGYAMGRAGNKDVFGVAFGVSLDEVSRVGPFAQLQNCGDGVEEIVELVVQLAQRAPGLKPSENRNVIESHVTRFKDAIATFAAEEPEAARPDPPSAGQQQDLDPRLLEAVQNRIGAAVELASLKRLRRAPSGELLRRLDQLGNRPVAFLAAIAPLREHWPWLYELGLEAYHAARNQDREKVKRAFDEFLMCFEQAVTLSAGAQDDNSAYFLKDLLNMLTNYALVR